MTIAMLHRNEIIGGVLIGGQSKRMGTCKALLQVDGRTFVEIVVDSLQAVADEVILLGDVASVPLALQAITKVADVPGPGGPLAGLVSLLERAEGRWSLLIACDMPLIRPQLLERLMKSCDGKVDAVAFRVFEQGRDHYPCCAMFHPRSRTRVDLERHGAGSLRGLLDGLPCRKLDLDAEEVQWLMNINTPQEYEQLRRRSTSQHEPF